MTASTDQQIQARQRWISVLAKADSEQLQQLWQQCLRQLDAEPSYQFIRKPESGLTMLRGRIGGSGQPFNLGEMTLTRCALRLESGALGVSYVQGRNHQHALLAALADGLLQQDQHDLIEQQLIAPLESQQRADRAARDGETADTKVDFFTLVRGED